MDVVKHRRLWIAADALAIGGLIFFVLYYLTAFRFDTLFTVEARQVDFTIWHYAPRFIYEHGRYPAVVTGDWIHTIFQYLPSAAAMMLPLSAPPQAIGFAVWLLIQLAAFAIVLWASLRLTGALQLRGYLLIALGAVLLSENSVSWDFRNHNTNLVYLALVLLGLLTSRIWLSALLLALSFNLKLYSGAILPVLAWRREWRLTVAVAVAAVLIGVLLPMAVFGPSAFLQLMSDWVLQIRYTFVPANQSAAGASLMRTIATTLGSDPASGSVTIALRVTQGLWTVLVVGYFLFIGRAQPAQPLQAQRARLADICVALMAPLPLSSWFIPYHAVVMLPAFMLLLVVAADEKWPNRLRWIAGGACLATQAVRFSVRDWNYRGAVFLAMFTIVLLALAAVRRALNANALAAGRA